MCWRRHASGEWSWFAHITRVQGRRAHQVLWDRMNRPNALFCRTRLASSGRAWGTMPGRAVALASRSSQLAILMADGQWFTLWSEGSSTGQPLPGKGKNQGFHR